VGAPMIDWLRRRQEHEEPSVSVGGRELPLLIRRHPRATRLTMRLAPDWQRSAHYPATLGPHARRAGVRAQAGPTGSKPARRGARAAPPAPGGTLPIAASGWRSSGTRACRASRRSARRLASAGRETGAARVRRWLEAEALRLLARTSRTTARAPAAACPELRLSRAQRRWGSCSGRRRALHPRQLAAGPGARLRAPLGGRARSRAPRPFRPFAGVPALLAGCSKATSTRPTLAAARGTRALRRVRLTLTPN
jgi:predicted metal-dependent hydrolase